MEDKAISNTTKDNKMKKVIIITFLAFLLIGSIIMLVFTVRHRQELRSWNMPEYFDGIGVVSDGLAVVRYGERHGIIDLNQQKVVVPFARNQGNIVFYRANDFIRVQIGESIAIICIDSREEIIPFDRYELIHLLDNGTALVTYDGTRGLVNLVNNEVLIPTGIYDWIPFHNNEIAIVELDGSEGLIDLSNGGEIIPLGEFSRIGQVSNDIAMVSKEQINKTFQMRWSEFPCTYEYCYDENCNTIYDCYNHCTYCHSCHHRYYQSWGVINVESGDVIIPFGQYDRYIGSIRNGMVVVREGDYHGLIEINSGVEVLPVGVYSSIDLYIHESRLLAKVIEEGNRRAKIIDLDTSKYLLYLYDSTPGLRNIQIDSEKGLVLVNYQVGNLRVFCLNSWDELFSLGVQHSQFEDVSCEEIIVISSGGGRSPTFHIYQRSNWELLNTIRASGGNRRAGNNNYNRVELLSNGMAATHIIWDYGDSRRAEFEIINIVTNEIILAQPSYGGICRIFFSTERWEYFPYADGYLAIRCTEGNSDAARRGLIETRTGREIIPISDDGPDQIRILPNGFVALRNGEQWRIKQIDDL